MVQFILACIIGKHLYQFAVRSRDWNAYLFVSTTVENRRLVRLNQPKFKL